MKARGWPHEKAAADGGTDPLPDSAPAPRSAPWAGGVYHNGPAGQTPGMPGAGKGELRNGEAPDYSAAFDRRWPKRLSM
ncbi:hypothetical protein GCM10008026_12190 [Chelatococcus composti]|nr:hypothetical protein GCM10008026_12190 [Chelatococcus composti]